MRSCFTEIIFSHIFMYCATVPTLITASTDCNKESYDVFVTFQNRSTKENMNKHNTTQTKEMKKAINVMLIYYIYSNHANHNHIRIVYILYVHVPQSSMYAMQLQSHLNNHFLSYFCVQSSISFSFIIFTNPLHP